MTVNDRFISDATEFTVEVPTEATETDEAADQD